MKYDDLARINEEEKKSTLSRIDRDFYGKVESYVSELESREHRISRRHSEEAVMLQHELTNALLIIDRIFKKRIRKIVKMASIKAFSKDPENTGNDTEYMTGEEKDVYLKVLDAILQGMKNTVLPILGYGTDEDNTMQPGNETHVTAEAQTLPRAESITSNTPSAFVPEDIISENSISDNIAAASAECDAPTPPPSESMENAVQDSGKKDLSKEYYLVRILKDIPKFAGSDERDYILHDQDVAVLPIVNARALIKRKMAVQIKIDQ